MPLCRAGLVYSLIRLYCLHYFVIGSENGAIQNTVQRVNSYDTVVAFSFFCWKSILIFMRHWGELDSSIFLLAPLTQSEHSGEYKNIYKRQ